MEVYGSHVMICVKNNIKDSMGNELDRLIESLDLEPVDYHERLARIRILLTFDQTGDVILCKKKRKQKMLR